MKKANQISFMGRRWDIANTAARKVFIVQQPDRFRVIARSPNPSDIRRPDILAEYKI